MKDDIWDTAHSHLAYDDLYSPKAPGIYTWPLDGETGFYKTLHAGPLPPLECMDKAPDGTEYKGCYWDRSSKRTFTGGYHVQPTKGKNGMTAEVRRHDARQTTMADPSRYE